MKKLALIPLVILVLGVFALPASATQYERDHRLLHGRDESLGLTFPPPTRSSRFTSRNPVARPWTRRRRRAASSAGTVHGRISLSGSGLITLTVTTPVIATPGTATATDDL